MIDVQDSELLRKVGPGTPMGDLFRRYWQPVLLSSDLQAVDGPPIRVKILTEGLVAFRDSLGRVGLVDEACPHRGLPMWRGINGNCRLTCIHHFWAFDVTGRCVDDMPDADQVRIKAYPTVESAGVIWAYMGTPDGQPPPPRFGFTTLSQDQLVCVRVPVRGVYLRCMEDHIASVCPPAVCRDDRIEVDETAHGLRLRLVETAGGAERPVLIAEHALPGYTSAPLPVLGEAMLATVPVDDWNSMRLAIACQPNRAFTPAEREAILSRFTQPKLALASDQGAVPAGSGVDNTREDLAPAEAAVARLWQMLLDAAGALRQGNDRQGA